MSMYQALALFLTSLACVNTHTHTHTEYFGAEPMHSGDEHLDEESDEEGEKDDGDHVTVPPSDASPK